MRILISLFILLFIRPAYCQNALVNQIYSQATRVSIGQYGIDALNEHIELRSAFSEKSVDVVPIKEKRIIRIDLVYTAYRESKEFSQEDLNKARIKRLIDANSHLTENNFFEWRLIEQTGCNDPASCKDFFHGFIVYYDKYYTKVDTRQEIDSINQDMRELDISIKRYDSLLRYEVQDFDCLIPPLNVSNQYLSDEFRKYYKCEERFTGKVFFDVSIDDKGRPLKVDVKGTIFPCKDITENVLKYILRWKRGIYIDGVSYPFMAKGKIDFSQKENIIVSDYSVSPEVTRKFNLEIRGFSCQAYTVDSFYTEIIPKIQKDAVSTVLFRNKWKDDLIIVDATGSMYPYTSDLLKWIRLNSFSEPKTFVFFNDGDDKPSNQKVIGQTGGLYAIKSSSYLDVRNMLFQSMRKGGGGDLFENNFEALLYGVDISGVSTGAIMIADNYSFPRDHILLKKYSGDLKIILCGTERGVNTHYLNLAYTYGFSIHTMTTDLFDLKNMKPGQSIQIDDYTYVLGVNGFTPVIQ
ncbi:MAG: hypothetical protein ACFHWX_06345 [Bacteroidota bacterium]